MRIDLRPATDNVSPQELEQAYLGGPIVMACDFYVGGAEKGATVPGGYRIGRIINVDHHAPTPRMSCFISSANLAIERVKELGLPQQDSILVINHTDCDSVLSCAILSGELSPTEDLGDAAVAADHTGIENPIADLLQGMQHRRNYEFSLRNIKLLLAGKQLESDAANDLNVRQKKREYALNNVAKFKFTDAVAFAEIEDAGDSEFYTSLLPKKVVVILLAIPIKSDPSKRIIKLRLSANAPKGLSLNALNVKEFDPNYGGRWNAGANKRGGGTSVPVEVYADEVATRLERAMSKLRQPKGDNSWKP